MVIVPQIPCILIYSDINLISLSFQMTSAGWLAFPNTVMASISKLTNVLDSKNCCGC